MMNTARLLFLCLVLAFGVAAPGSAEANGRCEGVSAAQGVSMGTIVNNIRRELRDSGGRVLRACTVRRGGKTMIEVRWLTSTDRVVHVTVDAKTGAILNIR